MSDPITKAEELAHKAFASMEVIRVAAHAGEATNEAISDAAWACADLTRQIVELLESVPAARRDA